MLKITIFLKRYLQITAFVICLPLLILSPASAQAEIVLQDLNGQNIPYSTLIGQWVVINYWAPWCQYCVEEIPLLNRFAAQHKDVAVFGINFDAGSIAEQQDLIEQFNIKYPILRKESAAFLKLSNVNSLPVTFIINPRGELSETLYGKVSTSLLKRAISRRF